MISTLQKIYTFRIWFLLLPLFLLPLIAFSVYKKDHALFPLNKGRMINAYTDMDFANGASRVDTFATTEDSISFTYTLIDSNRSLMPFAGVAILDTAFSLSINPFVYDSIIIDLESTERQQGYVMLTFFIDGISEVKDTNSYEVLIQKPFSVFPHKKQYAFALDDFFIPDWWLQKNNLTLDQVKDKKLHKMWHIFIDMNSNNSYVQNNTFTVTGITFKKAYVTEIFGFALFFLFYYVLLIAIIVIVKQHERLISQREKIELPYKTIQIIDTKLEDLKKIIDYVQQSFRSETLTIVTAAAQTKLSNERINALLQEHFNGATFKKYVNTIRINEAVTLLKNSDLKVSDIALDVGYTNITHFNRTFKKFQHLTPTQFRESFQEEDN